MSSRGGIREVSAVPIQFHSGGLNIAFLRTKIGERTLMFLMLLPSCGNNAPVAQELEDPHADKQRFNLSHDFFLDLESVNRSDVAGVVHQARLWKTDDGVSHFEFHRGNGCDPQSSCEETLESGDILSASDDQLALHTTSRGACRAPNEGHGGPSCRNLERLRTLR
jgi:hypothetical protein